jgi:hypothetical protein
VKKLVIGLLMVLAACSGETVGLELSSTEVALDVFSGRENPKWMLTEPEARELQARLTDLPEASGPLPQGKLGYRGFVVRNADTFINIGSGLVVVHRGETQKIYRDKNDAEDLLFKQAVQRGYGNLIAEDQ